MSNNLNLLVIAGEVSGDMHAAGLVKAIRQQVPGVQVFGIGGDELKAEGMELVYHARDMAALGFTEILPKLAFFRRVFNELVKLAKERKPDAVILVDYPGFNLRFAARAHAMGLKVIYYISPQVWAWHHSRIPKMARTIDRLLAIFPFEPDVFKGTGLKVDFVGHPLVDGAKRSLEEPPPQLPWHGEPRVAVLPGSRRQEITRMLPVFQNACDVLSREHPNASFIVASPTEEIAAVVRNGLVRSSGSMPGRWAVVVGQTRQIVHQANAAFVASGTATLETALMRCPMVIAYKVAPLSYFLLRWLVTVKHVGMVNIIANRAVCPELLQGKATPQALAAAMRPLLADTPERAAMLQGMNEACTALGSGGANDRAAKAVLAELGIRS